MLGKLHTNCNRDTTTTSLLFSGIHEGGLLVDDDDLNDSNYDVRCFCVCPSDRMKHTVLTEQLPDMATKAIGYRQVLEYLNREQNKKENEIEALDQFIINFTTATRRYARRQIAWFRKDTKLVFVPVEFEDDRSSINTVTRNIQEYCSMSHSEYENVL